MMERLIANKGIEIAERPLGLDIIADRCEEAVLVQELVNLGDLGLRFGKT
jgi:hypothetical protein